jgi:mannose-6-phosphate isomerase-like protein (cupin superfamily)
MGRQEVDMHEVSVKRIDEVEPYGGPNAIPGIQFRPVGRELGVTSFGMNVLQLAPGVTAYPEHDHVKDGQEEVYLVLDGQATLSAGTEQLRFERGMIARIGPSVKRKWLPGPQGVTLLALGAVPAKGVKS